MCIPQIEWVAEVVGDEPVTYRSTNASSQDGLRVVECVVAAKLIHVRDGHSIVEIPVLVISFLRNDAFGCAESSWSRLRFGEVAPNRTRDSCHP